MQEKVNASGVELPEEADQVLQTAAKAVDIPGHHHVEFTPDGGLVERIERRAPIAALSAADAVVLAICQPARSATWRSSRSLVGGGLIER